MRNQGVWNAFPTVSAFKHGPRPTNSIASPEIRERSRLAARKRRSSLSSLPASIRLSRFTVGVKTRNTFRWTPEVMRYCQPRMGRRVWPIKGRGGPGVPPWPKRPPRAAGVAPQPFIVGVDGLKAALYARLGLDTDGPGTVHAPRDRDLDWFKGLTAERPIQKHRKGVAMIEWLVDRGVRNEPLDCRVYATAALHGLYAVGYRLEAVTAASPVVVAGKSRWMAR